MKERSDISYVSVSKSRVVHNGKTVYRSDEQHFDVFALNFYRWLKTEYPKFHKMDRMAKLGFLTAEVLLCDEFPDDDPFATAIFVGNRSGSLDTDLRYQQLLNDNMAAPAVFVYTLSNIVVGEICIRHGIKGENTFLLSGSFDPETQLQLMAATPDTTRNFIGGWVEILGNDYEAFLYVLDRQDISRVQPQLLTGLYEQCRTS